MKRDRLELAAKKAYQKVKQITSDGKSSFMDMAPNLACILIGNSKREEKTINNQENREYFREYFRALNDYLSLIKENQEYSQRERFGDIFDKPYICAIPEIRDMTDEDAKLLGFNNARVAYIESSKINYGRGAVV